MLISGFRVKSFLFWLMLFPILLGTLFKVAFGNVYENDVLFRSIPTAVVETTSDPVFHQKRHDMEKEMVCVKLNIIQITIFVCVEIMIEHFNKIVSAATLNTRT